MSSFEKKAFELVDEYRTEMLALWEDIVNIDSGSSNKEGVDAVARRLKDIMDSMGLNTQIVEYKNAGNSIVAQTDIGRPKKGVVFAGHMDTVYPEGTTKKNPFRIEGGKAYGPGVLDMKGGIIISIYAAKILNEIGYNERPIKIIISGDEEVGHANSTCGELFIEESRGCAAAFDCETGFPDDGIIVGRKGVARFYLEVEGISSHAGNAPERGRSAILEMAHKIIDIQGLTDWEEGTTFNVGTIQGGTVPNAIPDYAKVGIDIRFATIENGNKVKAQMEEIAAKTYVEGTRTKLTGGVLFSPMETTEGVMRLFDHVKDTSIKLGFGEPYPKTSGGGSDAAQTVIAGVPSLCAFGVKGDCNHTPREYAIVESLFERTKLLIACVLNLKEDLI